MISSPLYARYGDVLVIAKRFTQHTRNVLEHVLESVEDPLPANAEYKARVMALARTHLALVLQELKTDKALQKECVLNIHHLALILTFFQAHRVRCKILPQESALDERVCSSVSPEERCTSPSRLHRARCCVVH